MCNNGKWIDKSYKCDGDNDCNNEDDDFSDENYCDGTYHILNVTLEGKYPY